MIMIDTFFHSEKESQSVRINKNKYNKIESMNPCANKTHAVKGRLGVLRCLLIRRGV